jgi:DNA-binding protein HU-beta
MATKKNDVAKKDTAKKAGGGSSGSSAGAKKSAPQGKKATGKKAASGSKEKSLTELVAALAERTELTKAKAKEVLDAHAELLISELKETGSVQLAGIGKLKLGQRAERQGRNPSTGEAITIKASKTVKFSGGKRFKDALQ